MEIFRDLDQLTLIVFILIVVILVWNITLSIKLFLVSKKINKFTRGGEIVDFETVIKNYINEAEKMDSVLKNHSIQIDTILDKISYLKGHVEIMRYNAFEKEGQDLSYSIAFLDEKKNGVVLTSIYNREGSNTYAKPIKNGESVYKLSHEEITVLENAIKKIWF